MISDLDTNLVIHMFEHAGYNYPADATDSERTIFRLKNALNLARAWLKTHIDSDYHFVWTKDDETEFIDEGDLKGIAAGELINMVLTLNYKGKQLSSLGGIILPNTKNPDPMVKVYEAVMAADNVEL